MVAVISVDEIYSHGWNYIIKMKLDYVNEIIKLYKTSWT